jgi:hypothetical protein
MITRLSNPEDPFFSDHGCLPSHHSPRTGPFSMASTKSDRASKSTIKRWFERWFKLRKQDKPPKTTVAPKSQHDCVVPPAGSYPQFKASPATQPRPSGMQTRPAPSHQRSPQPRSEQNFELYTSQPARTPALQAASEEHYTDRKRSRKERDDIYGYTPSGFPIFKYQRPEKYSEQWCRDNDLL